MIEFAVRFQTVAKFLGRMLLLTVVTFSAQAAVGFNGDDPGWRDYKSRFLLPEGRIVDTGNGNVSHTEGQGWGMFLAVQFDDRKTFDKLWRWTETHLARADVSLYAWRYDPEAKPPVADDNDAADGDLFMAWALQLAADRWQAQNYAERAGQIRQAIRDQLIANVGGYQVLLPGLSGFRHSGFVNLNLSYWVMPALRDFAARYPAEPWQAVIDSGEQLLERAQFGAQHLPADWLRLADNGDLVPAESWPPRFGFENVRVPLYFTWGGLRGIDTLERIARFWDQPAPPAWVDVQTGEVAPYSLSQGGLAINALLSGRPWAIDTTPAAGENYYSATLLLLARVAAAQLSLSAR